MNNLGRINVRILTLKPEQNLCLMKSKERRKKRGEDGGSGGREGRSQGK